MKGIGLSFPERVEIISKQRLQRFGPVCLNEIPDDCADFLGIIE
jgi:hypothetical protein